MDLVKVDIITALSANADLIALLANSKAIYPNHLSAIENPVFSCITISTNNLETMITRLSDEGIYQIDVWSKNSNDELWEIYNLVKQTINLQPLSSRVFFMRQISVNDDLFENDTHTFHLASKYKTFCNHNFYNPI
jgi:hypothetical protein